MSGRSSGKVFLIKPGHRYQVLRFDNRTGGIVLRGEFSDFSSTVQKAQQSGYRLVKE